MALGAKEAWLRIRVVDEYIHRLLSFEGAISSVKKLLSDEKKHELWEFYSRHKK